MDQVVKWQNEQFDSPRVCIMCHKADCEYPVYTEYPVLRTVYKKRRNDDCED